MFKCLDVETAFSRAIISDSKIFQASYEIINESYFCVYHKTCREHSEYFKLLFVKINLKFVTPKQILTYRKPNLPLASSICLVFLPLKMEGRLKQTKVYHTFFLLCLKRNDPQTFKKWHGFTFSSVCMLLVQLASVNVFWCMG